MQRGFWYSLTHAELAATARRLPIRASQPSNAYRHETDPARESTVPSRARAVGRTCASVEATRPGPFPPRSTRFALQERNSLLEDPLHTTTCGLAKPSAVKVSIATGEHSKTARIPAPARAKADGIASSTWAESEESRHGGESAHGSSSMFRCAARVTEFPASRGTIKRLIVGVPPAPERRVCCVEKGYLDCTTPTASGPFSISQEASGVYDSLAKTWPPTCRRQSYDRKVAPGITITAGRWLASENARDRSKIAAALLAISRGTSHCGASKDHCPSHKSTETCGSSRKHQPAPQCAARLCAINDGSSTTAPRATLTRIPTAERIANTRIDQ